MPGEPVRILSVSYEPSLLDTRRRLLDSKGYAVTSAYSLSEALDYCNGGTQFNLLILCHSIPYSEKEMMIKGFRANYPAPVLALKRGSEGAVRGADLVIDPDPRVLLSSVATLVRGKSAAA